MNLRIDVRILTRIRRLKTVSTYLKKYTHYILAFQHKKVHTWQQNKIPETPPPCQQKLKVKSTMAAVRCHSWFSNTLRWRPAASLCSFSYCIPILPYLYFDNLKVTLTRWHIIVKAWQRLCITYIIFLSRNIDTGVNNNAIRDVVLSQVWRENFP